MKSTSIRVLIITLCVLTASQTMAQQHWVDSVSTKVQLYTNVSTNSTFRPLWSYSSQWGLHPQYDQYEASFHLEGSIRLANFKHFKANAGLGGVLSARWKRSMLHEAYLDGKMFIFDYMVGLKAYSPLAQYDDMTSGSFIMSSNGRPFPKIGVGIFDYWSIPKTHDYLQIKGGMFVGRLFNERDADDEYAKNYTNDVIAHEKFAYARIGHFAIKPYLGLAHSVLMGGELENGETVPIDFWASFVGTGSEKLKDKYIGEYTNAAGAHQGIWDAGIDITTSKFDAQVYYKRPFSDGVGRKFFTKRSRDFYVGGVVTLKTSVIKEFAVEWMRTDYQCGNGLPDPYGYDNNGNIVMILPKYYVQTKEWFYKHFGEEYVEQWIVDHNGKVPYDDGGYCKEFYEEQFNHGLHFGGRVLYASNGFYPQGWSSGGLCMSSALFHSNKMAELYAPDSPWQRLYAYYNTRVRALTLSTRAEIRDQWKIFAKVSISRNYGNRGDAYVGGQYSWEEVDNYFFSTPKNECYAIVRTSRAISSNLDVDAHATFDFGDLYKTFGIGIGMSYSFNKSLNTRQ